MLVSRRAELTNGATSADCDDAHELIDAHDPVVHGPPHEPAGPLLPQPLVGFWLPSVGWSTGVESAALLIAACVMARIPGAEPIASCPLGCWSAHSVPLPSSESWNSRTLKNAVHSGRTSRMGDSRRWLSKPTRACYVGHLILRRDERHRSRRNLSGFVGHSLTEFLLPD